MSFLTPSQSVSHKRVHQCVNQKKKLSLWHPLSTFGNFSFFQESLWLMVNKVLQKLTICYKRELKHLFQCCILISRKWPCKTPFQHTVPPSPQFLADQLTLPHPGGGGRLDCALLRPSYGPAICLSLTHFCLQSTEDTIQMLSKNAS